MMMQGRQDDLLDLALEAGFSSKASFNRAFLAWDC
jgi:AraC-like DNA-binding protein